MQGKLDLGHVDGGLWKLIELCGLCAYENGLETCLWWFVKGKLDLRRVYAGHGKETNVLRHGYLGPSPN